MVQNRGLSVITSCLKRSLIALMVAFIYCARASTGPVAAGTLLCRDKGIDFYMRPHGGVQHVSVYAGSKMRAGSVGNREVVAGVGAYGARLGQGESVLSKLNGIKYCRRFAGYNARGGEIICEFSDGRRLFVGMVNGKIDRIDASGKFTTPEGITERSTLKQIEKAYDISALVVLHKASSDKTKLAVPRTLIIVAVTCIAAVVAFLLVRRVSS
jgi:hypothetical protein